MAIIRESYDITSYVYNVELKDNEFGTLGGVSLWNEGRRVADFRFKTPGTPLSHFMYHPEDHDDFIDGDIDSGQRDAIIDMLRNESPIRLLVFHDDTPERVINTIRLATGTAEMEPVGEGED